MLEPVTKFSISAAADGVVLNLVGRQNRAHKSLRFSYGSGPTAHTRTRKGAVDSLKCCEAYGVVGISAHFLVLQATRADSTQVCSTWSLAPF